MDPDNYTYAECHNCQESDRKYIGHTDSQCPVVRKAKQSRGHIAEEQDSSDSMSEDSMKQLLCSLDAKKLKSAFKAYAKDKKAKKTSAPDHYKTHFRDSAASTAPEQNGRLSHVQMGHNKSGFVFWPI